MNTMHDTLALSHFFSNARNMFGLLYVWEGMFEIKDRLYEKIKNEAPNFCLKTNKESYGKLRAVPQVQFGRIWIIWLLPCYATNLIKI